MGKALSDRRTPLEFAASRQVYEIAGKISDFERLFGLVEADLAALETDKVPGNWRSRAVLGELRFGFAGGQETLPMVKGEARTTVFAVCQRCLEPMELELDVPLDYLLAEGEFESLDVWELDEATFTPLDMVDEALVMAVPMTVLHRDSEHCRAMTTTAQDAAEKTRPFAALREQMEQTD